MKALKIDFLVLHLSSFDLEIQTIYFYHASWLGFTLRT